MFSFLFIASVENWTQVFKFRLLWPFVGVFLRHFSWDQTPQKWEITVNLERKVWLRSVFARVLDVKIRQISYGLSLFWLRFGIIWRFWRLDINFLCSRKHCKISSRLKPCVTLSWLSGKQFCNPFWFPNLVQDAQELKLQMLEELSKHKIKNFDDGYESKIFGK